MKQRMEEVFCNRCDERIPVDDTVPCDCEQCVELPDGPIRMHKEPCGGECT